ncbi:Hydrogenase maturation factor HypA [Streptomyces hirsutus]
MKKRLIGGATAAGTARPWQRSSRTSGRTSVVICASAGCDPPDARSTAQPACPERAMRAPRPGVPVGPAARAPYYWAVRHDPAENGEAMHEMSVALSIVDQVEQAARSRSARGVRRVRLDIGELAGVVADALAFCSNSPVPGRFSRAPNSSPGPCPARASCAPCGRTWDTGMPRT